MAVAWCINAYDCSWNLIRTLEQLQSSNIGVWVQYTAPNPLDDKKIDYIKYTDKCGCTCTLTWENEILIYATNWVIKNLSLTNDDTNERVIVKWNDIFGSNWLKTVVRYKTGSAPTSLTDWTLAVEETTKNQYATNGYWVSWLSDDTTYYFSVFGVDTDGTVINVQNKQIKTEFWRKPTANTLAYYKLESNINDYSWNWRNWTIRNWSLSYWTSWWSKSVANFNWNTVFSIPNIAWTYSTYTFNVRCKPTSTTQWQEIFDNVRTENTNNAYLNFNWTWKELAWYTWFAYQYRPNWWSNSYQNIYETIDRNINTRYNVCVIANTSWMKLYVNGTKVAQTSSNWTIILNNYSSWVWWAWIWWRLSTLQNFFRWYLSEFIFENVNWSESDLVKYVNKTKSKYWIS